MTTPEEVVSAKLKAFAPLTALVAQRIYPQVSTQEPIVPLVVYGRAGEEKQPKLSGPQKTAKVLIDVTTYGHTEAEYQAAATEVVNALDGQNDRANGVQAIFHVDSNADATEDGFRFMKHTFAVWHTRA
jgi:hypothetical protein